MRKFHTLIFAAAVVGTLTAAAQHNTAGGYQELNDGAMPDVAAWNAVPEGLQLSWASKDVHYRRREVPALKLKTDTVVYAWRGERASMQAVLFSRGVVDDSLSVSLSAWRRADGSGDAVPATQGRARFVNYVMSDDYQGCGTHPDGLPAYLVPDVIDLDLPRRVLPREVRPVWVTLEVPRDAEPGEYVADLDVTGRQSGERLGRLELRIRVVDRTLPEPGRQQFSIDFWQQPYATARYYGLEKWSPAHLEALRPYLELLARAGQRVVSAILFYEPWGEQSNDKFDAMVRTTKRADGTWAYDYSVFDRWVELCAECGIDGQINCYSMVPWDMTFRYYDEALGRDVDLKTTTDSPEYKALWTPFLQAFAEHLKEKGWYDKTCIAMDERGLSQMLDAYDVVQAAVPGFRMSLAGNRHSELVDKVYDYCLQYGQQFSADELERRRKLGYISTLYVCCNNPPSPNIFTNNRPSDGAFLPLHAKANGFDGFLHWSYMNWNDDPARDSRWRMFGPGDTYCVYPDGRSSVRFERFIEGVEAAEKVNVLRQAYAAEGNGDALRRLETALAPLAATSVSDNYGTAELVNYMQSVLNGAPSPLVTMEDYAPVSISSDAVALRWLRTLTTTGAAGDVHYSAAAASGAGYVVADDTLRVVPGSTFTLRLAPARNDDDLRWCRMALYADWDGDRLFNPQAGEQLCAVGAAQSENTQLLTQTVRVEVPRDARLGTTRLRLCYADSWGSLPDPYGPLLKGFALDLPVEVVDAASVGIASAAARPYRWDGATLSADSPVSVSAFAVNGALVDRAEGVRRYVTAAFTPGRYVLVLTDAQGRRSALKLRK